MQIDFTLRKYIAVIMLVVLSIAATGCSPIEKQAVRLANAKGCCESLDQAKFKPLDTSKETEFKIGEDSPTFQFEEGKSYFAAYTLPRGGTYTEMVVKSTIQEVLIRDTDQVFCPSLMFMDESKQVLKKQNVGLRFGGPGWFSTDWVGTANIPPGAHYVIFYTSADAVGKSVSRSVASAHSEFIDSNGQKVKINVDTTNSRMPCGQVGELRIILR